MSLGVRRLSIDGLGPAINNALIIGVIIAKQRVNKFIGKKDGIERGVWNITLRDSPADTINCKWWGSIEGALHYSQMFTIGDVVEITNPKIAMVAPGDNNNKFRPHTTSPFTMEIHEHAGEIIPHLEEDTTLIRELMHIPTKPSGNYLRLTDIISCGQSMEGQIANLVVAVTNLGPVRAVNSRKEGASILCRDIVVLDESARDFRITIWDEDILHWSDVWRSHDTVLFLADVRVQYNSFKRGMTVSISSSSIVTVNPKIPEADSLRDYAKLFPSQPTALLDHLSADVDVAQIDTVMTTAHLLDKAYNPDTPGGQFTALLFAYVTRFDLDGSDSIFSFRCVNCSMIQEEEGPCPSRECAGGETQQRPEFNIKMALSDHRGTLSNVYLRGKRAAKVLECTEDMFLKMNIDRRTERKFRLLLHRCEARVMALCCNETRTTPIISMLTCVPADPKIVSLKLPIY